MGWLKAGEEGGGGGKLDVVSAEEDFAAAQEVEHLPTPGTLTLAPQARSNSRCGLGGVGGARHGVCEGRVAGHGSRVTGHGAHVAEVSAVSVYEHALRTAQHSACQDVPRQDAMSGCSLGQRVPSSYRPARRKGLA